MTRGKIVALVALGAVAIVQLLYVVHGDRELDRMRGLDAQRAAFCQSFGRIVAELRSDVERSDSVTRKNAPLVLQHLVAPRFLEFCRVDTATRSALFDALYNGKSGCWRDPLLRLDDASDRLDFQCVARWVRELEQAIPIDN